MDPFYFSDFNELNSKLKQLIEKKKKVMSDDDEITFSCINI